MRPGRASDEYRPREAAGNAESHVMSEYVILIYDAEERYRDTTLSRYL